MTGEQSRSERAIVAAAAAIVLVALSLLRVDDASTFVAFLAVIAASELFEVSLPNEERYPLGLAPALGLALIGPINPVESHTPLSAVIVAFGAGMAIAIVLRLIAKRDTHMIQAATSVLALAGGAAAYHAVKGVDGLPAFDVARTADATDVSILGFAAMFVTALLIHAVVATIRAVDRDAVPPLPILWGTISATAALHLSILSVGALLAVSYPALGYWSFPLFLAPLAATQFAFRQFASIRRTYLQTIRALSKVPEMAGYTNEGHSRRVAALSVQVARELGVPDGQVDEIEYAALLHDIGRVSIPDPEQATTASNMELAVVGAAIVREAGHFPRVADMIERQHDPYRRRGEGANESLPTGSKIIKIASAYDDMTKPGGVGLSPSDAFDRLSLGMAFDFDPEVLQALRRVLEKQGDI